MRTSWEKQLVDLTVPERNISSSMLVTLSGLSPKELGILRGYWSQIAPRRREEIVRKLRELAEDDLALDFEEVYRFCLTDPSARVRVQAIEGLAISEDYTLVAPLISLLRNDASADVRSSAAMTLGRFATLAELQKLPLGYDTRISEALMEVIDDSGEKIEVRRRALEAIGPLNSQGVVDTIKKAYSSPDIRVKASAIYAMGENCSPEWLPVLVRELSSPEAEIRFEAAGASGSLEDERAVPHLLDLVDDPDPDVRLAAIDALGQIGGEKAKETLHLCLESQDASVREAAKEALMVLEFGEDPLSLQRWFGRN